MPSAERKYTLDTNLFIEAFRDPEANRALQHFHRLFAPFEYLSEVVAQELWAGVRTPTDRRLLERHVLRPFQRTSRLLTPSGPAWEESGDVLAALRRTGGLGLARLTKSFGNDLLLALSCRDEGVVLVTDNRRDFERIAKHVALTFVPPWPSPTP
jgi:predicted nucleic acid-binding protein